MLGVYSSGSVHIIAIAAGDGKGVWRRSDGRGGGMVIGGGRAGPVDENAPNAELGDGICG